MSLILDTNVVSDMRRVEKLDAQAAFVRWATTVDEAQCYISVVTMTELQIWVLSKQRRDPRQGTILSDWLHNHFIPTFSGRILPVCERTALRCAALHVPDKRPFADSLIAATALAHHMTVVTRNIDDFASMRGVRAINPWNVSR